MRINGKIGDKWVSVEIDLTCELHALKKVSDGLPEGYRDDVMDYIQEHIKWSSGVFGNGERTAGIIKHIEKELKEVYDNPLDVEEWVDIIILAIDGAWRMGFTAGDITSALRNKQYINRARRWNVNDENTPNEHIKEKQDGSID